ncbi:hypothetical protein HRbin16_00841 [bacterium HR16]|nr:hypothetical protein HRbin16_00841 [bacterium HR16]
MTTGPLLWIDNDALNYFCKAHCLDKVLRNAPYRFATTAFVQMEAVKGVQAGVHDLQDAIYSMQHGDIVVHDTDVPPLDRLLEPQSGLGLSDESLALCASYHGGKVLTNDAGLIRYLKKNNIGCMTFRDFLVEAEANGWLDKDVVEGLKRLAML